MSTATYKCSPSFTNTNFMTKRKPKDQDFENESRDISRPRLKCQEPQEQRVRHWPDPSRSRPVRRQSTQWRPGACSLHICQSSSCPGSSTHSHACQSGYDECRPDRSNGTTKYIPNWILHEVRDVTDEFQLIVLKNHSFVHSFIHFIL